MRKTYIQPELQSYMLHYAMPLLSGSLIGDSLSDDLAVGDDADDNLGREFDLGDDFDFGGGDDDFTF